MFLKTAALVMVGLAAGSAQEATCDLCDRIGAEVCYNEDGSFNEAGVTPEGSCSEASPAERLVCAPCYAPESQDPEDTRACYGSAPEYTSFVETARWMAHQNLYGVMSTLSTFPGRTGFPFGNVRSFSDGAINASTGKITWYASILDASIRDIQVDDRVSFTLSQEQLENYCSERGINPMDPLCARLSFAGNIRLVCRATEGDSGDDVCTDEYVASMESVMFDRHPAMRSWPTGHDWGYYEMDITQIWIISFYGEAIFVDPDQYYAIEC